MKLNTPFSLLAGVLVSVFAITGQSLWIDEANAAWKAIQPDACSFARELTSMLSSDTQMPGYMAGLWVWEKIFGSREWVLRAFNVPWLLLGCWALGAYWRVPALLRGLAMLGLLFSPFTWFYLDETRPYIMQMGAPTLAACAAYHLLFQNHRERLVPDLFFFLLGTLILSASSLFAMLQAFLFFVTLGFGLIGRAIKDQDQKFALIKNKRLWALLMVFALPFSLLAAYYLWTLGLGARASGVGRTGLWNLPFALYELAGFTGLGPDRNSIRESMTAAFRPYLPGLGLGAVAYLAVLVTAWRGLRPQDWHQAPAVLSGLALMIATLGVSFLVGVFGEFRLLGRHLTPVFPILMLCLAALMRIAWRQPWGRMAVLFFLGVMFISSLNQRFHPRFAKDDYRSAATLARQAMDHGQVIWWAADGAAARYYGIHPVHAWETGQVFYANNRDHAYLEQLPEPSLVILSKADVYDYHQTVREWLRKHNWTGIQHMPGFLIWTKEP